MLVDAKVFYLWLRYHRIQTIQNTGLIQNLKLKQQVLTEPDRFEFSTPASFDLTTI